MWAWNSEIIYPNKTLEAFDLWLSNQNKLAASP